MRSVREKEKTIPEKELLEILTPISPIKEISLFFDTTENQVESWFYFYKLKKMPANYWAKKRIKVIDKKDLRYDCPLCDRERYYHNKDKKHRAEKEQTFCYSCNNKNYLNFKRKIKPKKEKVRKTKEELAEISRQTMLRLYKDPNSVWGSGRAREKTNKTLREKVANNPEFKKSLIDKLRNCNRKTGSSKLEENFYESIKHLGFLPKQEVGHYEVDIMHDTYPFVIEVYGDFWHANPEIYDPKFFVNINKTKTAEEIWERDKIRISKIEQAGYKVLIFWEKQLKSKDFNAIEIINKFILDNFKKD